jgi:hypothetical protein
MMGMTDLSCLDLEHVCRQALPPALQMKNLFEPESLLRIAGAEVLASCPGRATRTIHQGVRVFGTNIEGREQSTALTFFS